MTHCSNKLRMTYSLLVMAMLSYLWSADYMLQNQCPIPVVFTCCKYHPLKQWHCKDGRCCLPLTNETEVAFYQTLLYECHTADLGHTSHGFKSCSRANCEWALLGSCNLWKSSPLKPTFPYNNSWKFSPARKPTIWYSVSTYTFIPFQRIQWWHFCRHQAACLWLQVCTGHSLGQYRSGQNWCTSPTRSVAQQLECWHHLLQ